MNANYDIWDSNPERLSLKRLRYDVEQTLAEAQNKMIAKKGSFQLFVEHHWLYFDKEVQIVLMERHPEITSWVRHKEIHYAVDAYLWAEQYVFTAYSEGDAFTKDAFICAKFANPFFVEDLHWFSRLLVAMSRAVESTPEDPNAEGITNKTRLQVWRNHIFQKSVPPEKWLEGTTQGDLARKEADLSITSTASALSATRKTIFKKWQPSWEAELASLNYLIEKWWFSHS